MFGKRKENRESREKIWKGNEEAAGTKRRFLRHGIWRLFATFYTHFAFLSLTTCSSASCLHGQFVRVRCLPAGLATSSLTSDSKHNPSLIPFLRPLRPRRSHRSARSSCSSSCARHPYANERPRGTHACRERRARKALVTRYSCRPGFLVHRLLHVPFRLHGFSTADLLPLPRISTLRRGLDPRRCFSPFLTVRAVAIRTGWGLNRIVNVGEVRAPARRDDFA